MAYRPQPGLEVDRRQPDLYPVQDAEAAPDPLHSSPRLPSYAQETEKHPAPPWTEHPSSQQPKRLPFGITPLMYGIVAAVIGCAVGAALGAGLGAGLSNSSTNTVVEACAPSNSTSNVTSSTPTGNPAAFSYSLPVSNFTVPPYQNTTAFTACPSQSLQYTDFLQQTYQTYCGLVYAPGAQADAQFGGVIHDLAGTLAYSLEDCTTQCSLWNTDGSIPHDTVCRAVSWVPDIGKAFASFGSNCVLKNASGPGDTGTKPYIISAALR